MSLSHPALRSLAAAAVLLTAVSATPAAAQDIKRGGNTPPPPRVVRSFARSSTIRVALKVEAPTKAAVAAPSTSALSKAAWQHYRLATDQFEQGKIDSAVTSYEAAVKANPKFADAWYGLGLAYNSKLDRESAIDAWQKAIKLDAKLYQAHAMLAEAYMTQGEFDLAVASYRALVDLKPNYAEALAGLGNVLFQLKRFDEAVPFFERAIVARNGSFPEARFNLGQTLFLLKNEAQAEVVMRKAIEELGPDAPETANAWYTIGTILYNKSDYKGSIEAFDKIYPLCKGCLSEEIARVYYNQSLAYEVNGQRQQAASAVEQVLRLWPTVPNADELRNRLARLRQ